VAVNQRIGDNG